MHPAVFIGGSVLLGVMFAIQEWMSMRHWSYQIGFFFLMRAWALQYLLWGILCWLTWWRLSPRIQHANIQWMLTRVLPLSIFASVVEEMIWVLFFKNLPVNKPHTSYWNRLAFELNAEFLTNLVIFWCAVGLFRAIGYYQRYREKEDAAARLETELVNAKLSSLRMQLNPHFLFNTLNSISSLMRFDINAADRMLEQLGSLFRITLERGEAQLIPLSDEIEFIEMYLALQDQRFTGRVSQSLRIDPTLYDALVPAMILQPIVENAYAHGLSKIESSGVLSIEAAKDGDHLKMLITNSGIGLRGDKLRRSPVSGVGLTNIMGRLSLHYGEDFSFFIQEIEEKRVQVSLILPLQFSESPRTQMTSFGG